MSPEELAEQSTEEFGKLIKSYRKYIGLHPCKSNCINENCPTVKAKNDVNWAEARYHEIRASMRKEHGGWKNI